MNQKKKYRGVVIPAVTPLTQEHKLDHDALERMFSNFEAHQAIPFILGTTGEAESLPVSLRHDFIEQALRLKKKDAPLYAGVSSNCFEETVHLAKFCFDKGVNVVAAHLPSYYPLSISQMKNYYRNLADKIKGPLIIYNIPSTTHMSIPLEVIEELSYHENIVGTKDSERSEERLNRSLELWSEREDFSHFLGWASKSADALINGSDGLIPSTGNLYPWIYSRMVTAVEKGDQKKAQELQRISDVMGDVYQKGRLLGESLAALKVLMKDAGLCDSYMMPPLHELTEEEEKILLKEFSLITSREKIEHIK